MRKKLDTRFPAARIKKIMQADEDVGKIAMAVPLLVSKALELFLQDLCDRTYDITVTRGAKTVNSQHLKHCVESFNVFDFLKETVSKVPELGGSEPAVEGSATRKRKSFEDEGNDSDEIKKSRASESCHTSERGRGRGRGRGRPPRALEKEEPASRNVKVEDDPSRLQPDDDSERGRGRGRGRGRPPRALEKEEPASRNVKVEDDPSRLQPDDEKKKGNLERLDGGQAPIRNFDLNVDPNEYTDMPVICTGVSSTVMTKPSPDETKDAEYPGWSLSEMKSMAIDPLQLAKLSHRFDEDEDYDEDG